MIKSLRDFRVYQLGYDLALKVHKTTQTFPQAERYELGQQMRKAALSVPANIAEGYARNARSEKDFKYFLGVSLGSCNEMQVYINFAKDLGYLSNSQYIELCAEYESLGKQLNKLQSNWRSNF